MSILDGRDEAPIWTVPVPACGDQYDATDLTGDGHAEVVARLVSDTLAKFAVFDGATGSTLWTYTLR